MKTWADFYDYILPLVPGATFELVNLHLRNSAIEFLDETGVVDYIADPIVSVAGQSTYGINAAGADYFSARVKSATYDGDIIWPVTSDSLDANVVEWRLREGEPTSYLMPYPTQIRLYPTPDVSGKVLQLELTLRPTRDSAGVEDYVFERYVESIVHGAVARLAAMPNKPWTNVEVALRAGAFFTKDKRDAAIEVSKNFTRTSLKVKLKRIV